VRRSYSAQQRDAARAAFVQHGLAGAARETGTPKGTLNAWARAGRWRTDAADAARTRARTERARDAWAEVTEERRALLAARLMHEAHAVLDGLQAPVLVRQVAILAGGTGEPARAEVVDVLLPGPTARDVRDRAQAAALLVDRMRSLTGEGAADQEPDLDLEAAVRTHQEREAELHRLRLVVGG
jgi:hypothetical protein